MQPSDAERRSILDALDDQERRAVRRLTRRRRFVSGEIIFHEGDPGEALHIVTRGLVGIRVGTIYGDLAMLTVLAPGDGFGEGAMLTGGYRTATAVALAPTETLSLSRADYEELAANRPAVTQIIIETLSAQVQRLTVHLLEALHLPVETRVLRRLTTLAELIEVSEGHLTLRIKQSDLAAMAGTTRSSTNRVLKELEAGGVIALSRGRIEILDLPELQRLGMA